MPQVRRPKRGSRAFWPRARARRIYPRIKSWKAQAIGEAKPLGFAGYKAGMARAMVIDTNPSSKTKGQTIAKAVTILDCPPLFVLGFKAYSKTAYGLKDACTVLAEKTEQNLARMWGVKKTRPAAEQLKRLEGRQIDSVRLLVHTKPGFKKKPEVFELGIGGHAEKQLELAKQILGKEIKASDALKAGDYVDVFAVTRGKGFEGPVGRFGVRIMGRKMQQMHRHAGSLGTTEPGKIRPTVPAAGQHGFQSRMEWNKRVLRVGGDPKEVTPDGHFLRYGILRGEPLLLEGSIIGPTKRLIRMRAAMRLPKSRYPVELRAISRVSQQGVRV